MNPLDFEITIHKGKEAQLRLELQALRKVAEELGKSNSCNRCLAIWADNDFSESCFLCKALQAWKEGSQG